MLEVMCCRETMKRHFKKELVTGKENERHLRKAKKYHICNKLYSEKDIRVSDNCHITSNYRDSTEGKFKYLSQEFSKKQLELVNQKGNQPYVYLNSFELFQETKLTYKEDFYSTLNDKHISDKAHNPALQIWDEFEMENMGGEYHHLHLKINVLLLGGVFRLVLKLKFKKKIPYIPSIIHDNKYHDIMIFMITR